MTTSSEKAQFSAGDNLTKLTGSAGSKSAGDFVHRSQQMAKAEGFANVSRKWWAKTISFEQGLELLASDKSKTSDFTATLADLTLSVDQAGKFVVRHADGREFRPTPHAIRQMGSWAGCGTWFVDALLSNPTDHKQRERFARDRGDSETLVGVLKNGFRRIESDKPFLFRTREDGTLRAMLSDQYAKVDNEWFVRALMQLAPGGRLSHWRGDGDTIWGNVLIPDTIREEKDSDYGGMLSVGNSEIGERRISSLPSIFRAICMNGCIWGQEEGKGIKQVHRGKIELADLFAAIKENLEAQIPLLPRGIDSLLVTRGFKWTGDSVKPLFAQVAKDHGMTRKQAVSLLESYNVERAETPDYARTLFSVVNSVTRAGQQLDNVGWVKFDQVGGLLAEYKKEDWDGLSARAKRLKSKDVDEVFALAS